MIHTRYSPLPKCERCNYLKRYVTAGGKEIFNFTQAKVIGFS
jgi:hypothetical protein